MKLTKEVLKKMIMEQINKPSMLLEEPVLTESSFNRIKDKIDNTDVAFVVMSADRHGFSRSENDQRGAELKQAAKAAGFPFTEIDGSWVEKQEDGSEVRVVEKSIVITDEQRGDAPRESDGSALFQFGKDMSAKYNQDAFIFGDVGRYSSKRQIDAYDRKGNRVAYGGPWTSLEPIEKDAEFWSRVRGSTFVFTEEQLEEVEVDAPNSVMEAYKKASENPGKRVKFVRRSK
jgi:hypothetical protein